MFVRTKTLLSESLKETLVVAARDSRLTCGLYDCGQLLQMYAMLFVVCLIYIYFNTFFYRKLSFVQLKLTVLYCYFVLQIILCLTLGVFLCRFCRNPESIILCLLPDDKCDDVTMQIHFTLIEAFCLENDILVLKVL